jgi:hypothetical protein
MPAEVALRKSPLNGNSDLEQMPIARREAAPDLKTLDPQNRTFEVVWSAGADVWRMNFWTGERYIERLDMSPGAVRLDRLNSGRAAVLNTHGSFQLENVLGVVDSAWLKSGEGRAKIRLSTRDEVKGLVADISAGIIRNISVGYITHSVTEEIENGVKVRRATDWEPVEMSFVPVPADPDAATMRSAPQGATFPCKITRAAHTREGEIEMSVQENNARLPNSPPAAAKAWSQDEIKTIMSRAECFGASIRDLNGLMSDARFQTIDAVTNELQNRAASSNAPRQRPQVPFNADRGSFGDPEFLAQSIGDALYARMSGKNPEGAAREWAGRSLLDMGAAIIEARGERVPRIRRDLATQIMARSPGYHTTGDFPVLLQLSSNRVLLDAYQVAASPLKLLAKRRDAVDFRTLTNVRLSEAPRLLEVKESAEVKYGSRSESKESFGVRTFARIFSITRQAIINDDLGAFADSAIAWGRAAAETEATELLSLFSANSGLGVKMDDGVNLYNAGHGNLASTGTALDVANLGAARQALRQMKGLDGKTPIGVTPKHLLVGPEMETTGEQVLASLAAAQISNVNPFSGKLTLHVEPRFTGKAWRLFADPAELATIEIAYLTGGDGPIVEVFEGEEVLGTSFRAILDFGCGITEFRGTYLNPGT